MKLSAKAEELRRQSQNKSAAIILDEMESILSGEGGLKTVNEKVKAIESMIGDLDREKVAEEFDRLKAMQETMARQIRNSRRGFYVSGIEDVDFSMVRAIHAAWSKDWSAAGHELEVMKQAAEKRAEIYGKATGQVIGDDAAGGFLVPDQVIADVIAPLYTRSVFVALDGNGDTRCRLLEGLTSPLVTIPEFKGGLVAYWTGEEDEIVKSLISAGELELKPRKLAILVKVNETMDRFGGFGWEDMFRRDMIAAAAKKLDWTIAYGKGTANMPQGIAWKRGIKIMDAEAVGTSNAILTVAAAEAKTTWNTGELNFDGLDDMHLAMDEDDVDVESPGFATISGPRYLSRLRRLKIENYSAQSSGNPYLLGRPMLTNDELMSVIGAYGKSNQIAKNQVAGASIGLTPDGGAAEDSGDVFVGDFNEVIVGRWAGVEILTDGGVGEGFSNDYRLVKLRLRADVAVRHEQALTFCPNAKTSD